MVAVGNTLTAVAAGEATTDGATGGGAVETTGAWRVAVGAGVGGAGCAHAASMSALQHINQPAFCMAQACAPHITPMLRNDEEMAA
jgi:hypothetical protein